MAARRPKLKAAGRTVTIDRVRTEPLYRMPVDFDYTPTGKPCGDGFNKLAQNKCLVQLTFDEGVPALRFCDEKGAPGRLVHVDSPAEAAEAARLGCECFEKTGSYEECLPEGLKIGSVAQVEVGKLPGLRGLPAGSFGKTPAPKKRRSAQPRGGTAGLPRGASCRRVGKLDAKKRNALPPTAFGLPESRDYPMPDPSHAKNAKARAKAQLNKGNLSRRNYDRIVRKADRVIAACGGGRKKR